MTPWQRGRYGSVVGIGVDKLVGITVPSMVGAFLPKSRTIEIWLSNAIEGEGSYRQW